MDINSFLNVIECKLHYIVCILILRLSFTDLLNIIIANWKKKEELTKRQLYLDLVKKGNVHNDM